jgi:4-hydroxysphinganine ceramide fatty acyl 2-hydroxylase
MAIGVFAWTLVEYVMHRFLFHGEETWLPNNKTWFVIHFLMHGIHHAFPMDRYRLVFPVALGYVLLLLVFKPLLSAILSTAVFPASITGGILGYIGYDMIHYFIHHSST